MDTSNSTPQIAVAITDTLLNKVVAIIADLTGGKVVFTAFDVTKAIREANVTMNVPHTDVREMVLGEFFGNDNFDADYERTLTDLTVGQQAFVYHPDGVSAETHPLAVQSAPVNVNTDSDLTVENRLNISRSVLNRLSLKAGQLVKVSTDNGVMTLTATTDTTGDTLVVNSDSRLRIGEQMLTEAFGMLYAKYDVSYNATDATIEVKPQ